MGKSVMACAVDSMNWRNFMLASIASAAGQTIRATTIRSLARVTKYSIRMQDPILVMDEMPSTNVSSTQSGSGVSISPPQGTILGTHWNKYLH